MIYTPEQIRQILGAATPGPWLWRVGLRPDCEAYLMGGGGNLVMDFVRRGMQRAIARFNVNGVMHRADEIAVPRKGQEHNAAWNSTLTHPDAVLMQEAPTIIRELLAENARLRGALQPFANFACDPRTRTRPCDCHNCVARAALEDDQ